MGYTIRVCGYQTNTNAFFHIVEKGCWHYANGAQWTEQDGVLTLTMGDSGTSGMLRFKTEQGKEAPASPRRPPILALAVDPGPVQHGQPHQFQKAFGHVLGSAAHAIILPFERTPEEACLSTLWSATASEVEDNWEDWQGVYVSTPGTVGAESDMARDEKRGARLWDMSESLVRMSLGHDALLPWEET